MTKDKTKSEVLSRIREEIIGTTIPEELQLCYLLANAAELVSEQAFGRIKRIYAKNGLYLKENEICTGLHDYSRFVRQATWAFFERVAPHIEGAASASGRGARGIDSFNEDTNSVVKVLMTYIDRTAGDAESAEKFEELLKELPSKGKFSDEDFERYNLKRL